MVSTKIPDAKLKILINMYNINYYRVVRLTLTKYNL